MSKTINIMHLSMNLPMGGSSRLLLDILKCFASKDYINNILVVASDYIADDYREEITQLPENSLYKVSNSNFFLTVKKILSIIRKNNIQIIHCDSFGSFKILMVLKLLKPGLKIVYTIHDTNLITKYRIHSIIAKKLFIDAFIAISEAVASECRSRSLNKVCCIKNGVDLSKFSSKKAFLNLTPDSTINIINVARIQLPKKGHDVMIKALQECKKRGLNFKCNFVGDVDKSTVEAYKQMQADIKNAGMDDNIRFLGNRTDIPELLQESDLFILPSRFEGFGLVIIEAMAAGLPVIASNIDGPKEIISNNKNGLLFESENYIDLADKICEFYNDRKKMQQIAQAGFELSKKYDIEIMCADYYKLYKRFL